MLDAILMEEQAVPAIAIVTSAFVFTARAMAESWGKPDYPFLQTPHPISHLTWEELDERADRLAEAVEAWGGPRRITPLSDQAKRAYLSA